MTWIDIQKERFEITFHRYLNTLSIPEGLREAMCYSSLNGGKRLRALLTLASGDFCSANAEALINIAMAIESIHAYSLIHDDLPAMDNDDLRRGQPTNHIQFGEATAILAGDALLTDAFSLIASMEDIDAKTALSLVKLISNAAGSSGMVGGQFIDLDSEKKHISPDELQQIHSLKTGALIRASILSAPILANSSKKIYQTLESFADKLGLAFQIKDDILDATQSSAILGKTAGKDIIQEKATYVSILGLNRAKEELESLTHSAIQLIQPYGVKSQYLVDLASYVVNRDH